MRKMENGKLKMKNILKLIGLTGVLSLAVFAQTSPPAPSAPKSVKIPAVKETVLKNGLKVAVIENKNVPLVTVGILVKSGAKDEDAAKAGLADMTTSLLTKGTKTRSATDIAEQIEFLGGSINSGAGWNNSGVTVTVMSDKLDQAMDILADVILNPSFKQDEIDLLKSQTLDGLSYNLSQPGFLANYVASAYSFGKHPAGGTVESINSISRDNIVDFHNNYFNSNNSVLIFTGDITGEKANSLSEKFFGKYKQQTSRRISSASKTGGVADKNDLLVKRILVIDLPNSGQAAVKFVKKIEKEGRIIFDRQKDSPVVSESYYPAILLNSLLGGGYSSRLNQEIRIKRGLSYGAGSNFSWDGQTSDFATSTQTKNESAAEVAELVVTEIKKLSEADIPEDELNPRRLVLTGGFGRSLETTRGLANAVADLYAFGLSPDVLNSYMNSVQSVTNEQIKQFASENFSGGDIIIVGDYSVFKADLEKRFPGMKVDVVKADDLDISRENLRKAD